MRSMKIFIKRINDRHVFIFDIEIKNISIASDTFRIAGFWNNGNSFLNGPAKTYLCRSPCVFGSQNTHDIIVKIGTSCQRGISLYLNAKSLTVFDQLGWITQGMTAGIIPEILRSSSRCRMSKLLTPILKARPDSRIFSSSFQVLR